MPPRLDNVVRLPGVHLVERLCGYRDSDSDRVVMMAQDGKRLCNLLTPQAFLRAKPRNHTDRKISRLWFLSDVVQLRFSVYGKEIMNERKNERTNLES